MQVKIVAMQYERRRRRQHVALQLVIALCYVLLFVPNVAGESDDTDVQCPNRNDFRCTDGECIDAAKECNGENDCADRSDELDCGRLTCCRPFGPNF